MSQAFLNRGADLLSRGHCRYDDWSLHPLVMREIRMKFGSPIVDLFASEENAKCPTFFGFSGTSTLGLDAMAHEWPEGLLYAFPPLSLIPPNPRKSTVPGSHFDPNCTGMGQLEIGDLPSAV